MEEHVILVAFSVKGGDRRQAYETLAGSIGRDSEWNQVMMEPDGPVVCWWLAEDDRLPTNNADEDSAVFCNYGEQERASAFLYGARLTPAHNVVVDRGSDGVHE